MSQLPRPLRAYILSLATLFPVDLVLYWLDVSMGWWFIIVGLVAVIGASSTLYETTIYLRPSPTPPTRHSPPAHPQTRPPIDLTPNEFRHRAAHHPESEEDADPAVIFPRSRSTQTTTFPRTLSL